MKRRVEFGMGNAEAPNSPWGRDELEIADDGWVRYGNRRGRVMRTCTLQLSTEEREQLFTALVASPFPNSSRGPFSPGSALIELSVTLDEQRTTARLEYHTALKTPGYDLLVSLLAGLAARLRGG